MQLYSDVFCIEMGRKARPAHVHEYLKQNFQQGRALIKSLTSSKAILTRHNEIEGIHTPRILAMTGGGIGNTEPLMNQFRNVLPGFAMFGGHSFNGGAYDAQIETTLDRRVDSLLRRLDFLFSNGMIDTIT